MGFNPARDGSGFLWLGRQYVRFRLCHEKASFGRPFIAHPAHWEKQRKDFARAALGWGRGNSAAGGTGVAAVNSCMKCGAAWR